MIVCDKLQCHVIQESVKGKNANYHIRDDIIITCANVHSNTRVCILHSQESSWLYTLHPRYDAASNYIPVHMTPTSSVCLQSLILMPLWEHSLRLVSVPLHSTLSSSIGPLPGPKYERKCSSERKKLDRKRM